MTGGWCPPGFALLEPVDPGSSGRWRARDLGSGRQVDLRPVGRCDPVTQVRLRREAAVAGALAHPHLTPVRDVVSGSDGSTVLVLDPAPGGSLVDLLGRRGRLTCGEVVTLLAPVAASVAALHERGLPHGHVVADNVLLTRDGRPLLAEPGVHAAVTGLASSMEADVAALAALGRSVLADPASDGIPGDRLRAVLDRAGSPDPTLRPTAAELAADLLAACRATPLDIVPAAAPAAVGASSTPLLDPATGSGRRWLLAALLAATGVVMVVVIAAALGLTDRLRVGGHGAPAAVGHVASMPPVRSSAAPPSWSAVITTLERRRAEAFVDGDSSLLRAVYVRRSRAGRRDRATLRSLSRRGWRVMGLRPSVRRVSVLSMSDADVVVRVRDALSAYDVVDGEGRLVRHARARPARPVVMALTRTRGGWRIRSLHVP